MGDLEEVKKQVTMGKNIEFLWMPSRTFLLIVTKRLKYLNEINWLNIRPQCYIIQKMSLWQIRTVGFSQSFCIFQRQKNSNFDGHYLKNFAIYNQLLLLLNLCVPIKNETRIWLRVTMNRDAGEGGQINQRQWKRWVFRRQRKEFKDRVCLMLTGNSWSSNLKRSGANCSGSWMQLVVMVSSA